MLAQPRDGCSPTGYFVFHANAKKSTAKATPPTIHIHIRTPQSRFPALLISSLYEWT